MKLLINFLQSQSGGARSYLRNILPYISDWENQHGMTVYVLLYKRQIDIDQIDVNKINIKPIVIDQVPKFLKPLIEQLIVKKAIKEFDVDTLFTPYQVSLPFSSIKTVSMLRNMEAFLHWQFSSTLRNRIRNIVLQILSSLTIRKSDLVIAVSDFAKNYMLDQLHIPEDRIIRVYHGRDHRFNPIKSDNDYKILQNLNLISGSYIFTSGSILPYRKLETIIEAFAKSAGQHNSQLVIAGDSNDIPYKNLIRDLIHRNKLEDRVIQLGFIDIEKIIVLYRHARLFVTATEIEACPNIAIEAMASGCRIIASDKAPLPEMFQDKVIYFKAGNSFDLAEKIIVFFNNSQDSQMPNYDIDRFSWSLCADNTYKAISRFNPTSKILSTEPPHF